MTQGIEEKIHTLSVGGAKMPPRWDHLPPGQNQGFQMGEGYEICCKPPEIMLS